MEVLANEWLDQMDPDTAQEYLTGVELDVGEEEEPDQADGGPPNVDPDVVSQLQSRIAELEAMVSNRPPPAVPPAIPPMPGSQKPSAVPRQPVSSRTPGQRAVSGQDWAKLKALAGSPPPRVASVEQRRPNLPATTSLQETMFADLEKEAAEEDLAWG